jgi:hypothetical protein
MVVKAAYFTLDSFHDSTYVSLSVPRCSGYISSSVSVLYSKSLLSGSVVGEKKYCKGGNWKWLEKWNSNWIYYDWEVCLKINDTLNAEYDAWFRRANSYGSAKIMSYDMVTDIFSFLRSLYIMRMNELINTNNITKLVMVDRVPSNPGYWVPHNSTRKNCKKSIDNHYINEICDNKQIKNDSSKY